eukprot:Hpha_TRINITY_DN15778_c0_g2::TRINITY_DN15778_c0_g2_i1::g.40602::m.40602
MLIRHRRIESSVLHAALVLVACGSASGADCGSSAGVCVTTGFTLKPSPASITCAAACTEAECCNGPCAVPTRAGASVSGCVEGGSVSSGTACSWTVDTDYTCTNVPGTATCTNGAFDMDPSCTDLKCTGFDPTPYSVSALGSYTACEDVHSAGTCALTCNTGYNGAPLLSCGAGQVWSVSPTCTQNTCSTAASNTDAQATYTACNTGKKTGDICTPTCAVNYQPTGSISLICDGAGNYDAAGFTCPAIACSNTFSPAAYNVQGPVTTTGCNTAAAGACTVNCMSYYRAGGSATTSLSCTATDTWTVAPACTDACATADGNGGTFVVGTTAGFPTGTNLALCGVGSMSATVTTCSPVCVDGYTSAGTTTITCGTTGALTATATALTCTEENCVGYVIPTGSAAGTCTAVAGVITLGQITGTTCNLACATGYTQTAGTLALTCTACSSATCTSTTTLTCTATSCATAFDFAANFMTSMVTTSCDTVPEGACTTTCLTGYSTTAGSPTFDCQGAGVWTVTNACTVTTCATAFDNTVHNIQGLITTACDTAIEGSCPATCDVGYSGSPTVSCDNTANWVVTGSCTENSCASFDYTASVANAQAGAADPCTAPVVLSSTTDPSCTIQCPTGYSTTGSGTVTCTGANNGDAVDAVTLVCTETCGLHTCSTVTGGQIQLRDSPSTINCGPSCIDSACCAGVVVTPTSLSTTEKTGAMNTATFEVYLVSQPAGDTSFTLTSLDTTEGLLSTVAAGGWNHGTVTLQTSITLSFLIASSTWNTRQTITVTGQDDAALDGDITYNVQVGVLTSAGDADYAGLDPLDVTVTNFDNEITGTKSWTYTMTATATTTNTVTSTSTVSLSATRTVSGTVTRTLSGTPSLSGTTTLTATVTRSVSGTSTMTATRTQTQTVSHTVTSSATSTTSHTMTLTPTRTGTVTRTLSITQSVTSTVSQSLTTTQSLTMTPTRTGTVTRTVSATQSVSSSVSQSLTDTQSLTMTPTRTGTVTKTVSVTQSVSSTASQSLTITKSLTMTPSRTGTVTR